MEENATQPPPPPAVQMTKAPGKQRMYPELIIPQNTNPKALYAFPVVGLVIKLILIIPAYIVYAIVGFISGVFLLITPFVILFKGKYWDKSYEWNINYFTYGAKIQLYLAGITDKYPGFTLDSKGFFELHLAKPESPSRLMAFPLLGYFGRYIIMIPYTIYSSILGYGMYAAVVFSWFGVTLTGKYPESLYEFIKDQLRVSIASDAYMSYLSDTYPSFKISMNHKKVKIILLIIAVALSLLDLGNEINSVTHSTQYFQNLNNSTSNSSGSDE